MRINILAQIRALPDRDPKRILRVVFRREWGVAYLQFMQTTRPCGHEMFDCIFPFKHHLYSYTSACVFQNADGTLDEDLRKDLVEPTLIGKVLSGRASFRSRTENPRACRRAPRAAEAKPLPREDTTPPVINT